jgi:1,4-alpha-glucan branching enzyme
MAIRDFLMSCAFTATCLTGTGLHAQSDFHSYGIKDGRMTIAIGQKIRRAALDSFIARYNLDSIGLHQLLFAGIRDSLKKLGWEVEIGPNNTLLISKPLISYGDIGNPASQMQMTEKHPTIAELFPPVNNGVQFGHNRFRRKNPFAVNQGIVTIFLRGEPTANKVMLAGSFNEWSPFVLAMRHTDSGWIANVPLSPGKYWYKFIVDGTWTIDDDNQQRENDGRGNTNSVFYVTNTIFILPAYANAHTVYLSGSFNDWRRDQLQMVKTPTGWKLPLFLAEGTHTYRYIVDGQWMADPANPDKLPNEYGEFNSVVRLGQAHIFELPGYTAARQVVLSGSFNHWRKNELFMERTATGWRLAYTIGPGNYEYRFIVDGQWITDPQNPMVLREGNRISNSYLIIEPNYTFRLKGNAGARQVFLSGDFVGWSPSTLAMQRQGDEWVCTVHLSAGKHLYKFIVDGKWIIDPGNRIWEQNEAGTGNSIVWIER